MKDSEGESELTTASIVLETLLALFISGAILVEYVDVSSGSGFGSATFLLGATCGGIVGISAAYWSTTRETLDVRYGILLLLLVTGLGYLVFPNGLPDVVFVSLLGVIWGSICTKIVRYVKQNRF